VSDKTSSAVPKDLDSLRTLRDELRVQMELGKAEARDRFEQVEKEWSHLEGKLKQLGDASREELGEVQAAVDVLADQIREGYRHLKSLI